MDLIHLFSETFKTFPHKTAFIFKDEKTTFAQIQERANLVSHQLNQLGISSGDRIALYLPNSLEFIYAYLGILSVGAVVVPLNVLYRSREAREIIQDSEAKVLISRNDQLNQIDDLLPTIREKLHILNVGEHGRWTKDEGRGTKEEGGGTKDEGRWTKEDELLLSSLVPPPSSPVSFPSSLSPHPSSPVPRPSSIVPRPSSPVPRPSSFVSPPSSLLLAAICYTSGTTGRSKGAMLSHGNFTSDIKALIATWAWTSQDILVLTVPMFHMHGLGVALNGALATGCTTVLLERFDAETVLSTIQKNRCTLFMGVPTMYTRFLQIQHPERFDLSSMRLFIAGSAPLPKEVFQGFKEVFGFEILERYGLTETIMNTSNPYRGKRKPGSIGLPLPGIRVSIVNKEGAEIEDGQIGEIKVQGPNVFQGYWKRPEETSKTLVDGWMLTGDLGFKDTDGYIQIVGRAKDVIINGGFNVYPREVEEVLCSHPLVKEAAVVGIPDKIRGELVKAYIVLNELTSPVTESPDVEEDLLNYCKQNLASFKVPRKLEFLTALPRTASGKVVTRQLPNLNNL